MQLMRLPGGKNGCGSGAGTGSRQMSWQANWDAQRGLARDLRLVMTAPGVSGPIQDLLACCLMAVSAQVND